MSFKRVNIQHKKKENKETQRRFELGWAIQTKLNSQNYELMFIDEFSLSKRSFKFFGWGKKGKPNFIRTMPDTFRMSFYIASSKNRFYGIMGVGGTGNSEKFIHFLTKILKERLKPNLSETKRLIIVLDNASIHKTCNAIKFIVDSKIPMITIPPYEPCLNPIEKLILAIKSKLRQKKQRGQ